MENRCYGCMTLKMNTEATCDLCGHINGQTQSEHYYLQEGSMLADRYMVGKVLGHGGFGITYIGFDTRLDIVVAIKEYLPSDTATRALGESTVTTFSGEKKEQYDYGLERFLDEAKTLARYNQHPCIVSTSDFFKDNNTAYLVMEYLDGISLSEYLKRKGRSIAYKDALEIMMPVMDALKEVHKSGLIHRDISPDNIYITRTGQVKLLDFGAARFALGEKSKSLSVVLKPGFAPPEQYSSKGKQGPWTDIYAVASTMYRMVHGKNLEEAVDRLMDDALELSAGLDPKAKQVLTKALAIKVESRYQSIEALQKALSEEKTYYTTEKSTKQEPVSNTGMGTNQEVGLNRDTNIAYSKLQKEQKKKTHYGVFVGAAFLIIFLIGLAVELGNSNGNKESANAYDTVMVDVRLMAIDEAIIVLEDNNIDYVIEYVSYPDSEEGTIITQSPKPNFPLYNDANAILRVVKNEVEVETLEHVELKWFYIGNGQQNDVDMIEEAVNTYLKDKINVTVQLQCFDWGSYDSKMEALVQSDESFDICFTSSWTNSYYDNAMAGAFVPLNNYFDTHLKGTAVLLGETFLSGASIDGVNYAIPAIKENAHQWGILFRADLVEKYNFDINSIKSIEDLEPMLEVIRDNESGVYPLQAGEGISPWQAMDFDYIGDDFCPGVLWNDSKDLVVFNQFEAAETYAHFRTMHRYYNAGFIREDAAAVNDYYGDIREGKVFASVRSVRPGTDLQMLTISGYEWLQIPLTSPVISNRDTKGSMQAISSSSANPERAAMFLELVNTDPYLSNLINFGIEGVHYNKINDTTIELIGASDAYNPSTSWMFGNQLITYLLPNEDPLKWQKIELFNNEATGTQSLGFVFDNSTVKNEIAQCYNVWDQYLPVLETGTVDPDEYLPIVIQAFKDAGAEVVIAEMQRQLDAWAQKNK